jgi:hypothetical protein
MPLRRMLEGGVLVSSPTATMFKSSQLGRNHSAPPLRRRFRVGSPNLQGLWRRIGLMRLGHVRP